jgi:hypothetical protein
MSKSIENSQPHTIQGERGQQMVSLKDIQIAECFLRGMLDAATYYGEDNNYAPTEKLNYADLVDLIYKVRWMENFDPVAIVQSACCHMEKVMGIYPNIPPLIEAKNENV